MSEDIKKAIAKMADLGRLELSGKDAKVYIERAERVIEYFNKLGELDTSRVEPTSHTIEAASLLREDKVINFEASDKIIDQAPETEPPFIVVPKVI